MSNTIYVHYGSDHFDLSLFIPNDLHIGHKIHTVMPYAVVTFFKSDAIVIVMIDHQMIRTKFVQIFTRRYQFVIRIITIELKPYLGQTVHCIL